MKMRDLVKHVLIWKTPPSKWQALKELSALLFEEGAVSSFEEISKALTEREKIVSTGIGIGVAVPHARLPSLNRFVLAIGVVQEKGIEWNAIDKKPVQLVFAIGAPSDTHRDYLELLSGITSLVKNPAMRKKLIKVKSKEDLFDLVKGF